MWCGPCGGHVCGHTYGGNDGGEEVVMCMIWYIFGDKSCYVSGHVGGGQEMV